MKKKNSDEISFSFFFSFCVYKNERGKIFSKKNSTLVVRPQVSVPNTELVVVLGEEATFECQASGDPAPKLVWRRLDQDGVSGGGGAPLPVTKSDDNNRSIYKVMHSFDFFHFALIKTGPLSQSNEALKLVS